MCYVRKFGRPSLFITMTCNPGWKEITDEMLPKQTAQHRPDLIARVFNLKRKELIKQLTKHCIFGKTIVFLCSIEWQKRGLLHAHILVWLSAEHSIHADDINAAISAELLDPNSDKVRFDIVMTNRRRRLDVAVYAYKHAKGQLIYFLWVFYRSHWIFSSAFE